jgi:putative membrane protein
MSEKVNKNLILRESLALQRTTLANQTTFLSFLRTAMYFAVAGLSTRNVLQIENSLLIEISFYTISLFILILGIVNFFRHKKMIIENKKHIGDYKLDYYE